METWEVHTDLVGKPEERSHMGDVIGRRIIFSCVGVSVDGVWIGNWIY
jgi:hypothetical protein